MPASDSLKARLRALVDAASARGVQGALRIPDMTPRQADALLSAHIAARRAEMARLDAQAWMTGYYVLRAMHAPRRYPAEPCLTRENASCDAMTEDAMKAALARHGKEGTI